MESKYVIAVFAIAAVILLSRRQQANFCPCR